MTIVAYHKGALYADRIHELPVENFAGNRYSSKKLFINNDRTIAFCYTGSEVNVSTIDSIFAIFQTMIELNRQLKAVANARSWITEPQIEAILQTDKRFYVVMTRDEAFFIKEGMVLYLDKKDVLTDGLDGEYFKALALTGMKPKDIIPYIHEHLSRRVTKEFDSLQQHRLKELKLIHVELTKDEAATKLTENLERIKDRELQS